MNKFDKKLRSIFKSNNFEMSKQFTNMLNETLSNLPDKKINSKNNVKNLRFALATVFCILLITGTTFAKDIGEFFQGLMSSNNGVISAIKNNFIETTYGDAVISNNVKAYISNILMDDYKLCISLSFELPEKYTKDNIHRIKIPNIIIYDENENILYANFEKEINYSIFSVPEINENIYSYETSSDIGWVEKNGNIYSFSYIINSMSFPKSQTVNIKFDELNFIDKNLLDYSSQKSSEEVIKDATLFTIHGNWNLHYNLSEKTYNRENYIYRIKNYNDFKYNIPEELIVSNTETRLEFQYDLHNIISGEDISIDREAYIKNGNKILVTSKGGHQYIGYNARCSYTFELSKFNALSTMQIVIPLDNGENITLELEKIEK